MGTEENMTTEQKAVAIIKKMLEFANKDMPVTISEDWHNTFGATLTVGGSHTHVGWSESTFEQFVDGLYNSLHGGSGLSFAKVHCNICGDPNCPEPNQKH